MARPLKSARLGADANLVAIDTVIPRISSTHRRRRAVLGLGLLAWVLSIGLVAHTIQQVQRDGRRQLEERFEIRADIAARFVQTYAREIIKREQAQAAAQLAKPRVSRRDFDALVAGGGYQAAVLLDARGRLLQIAPAKPALIGRPVGQKYAHLRSALSGVPEVSRVVPAAANGTPIVGFATPFDTPQGRRVFSGGFDITQSPLAAYLPTVASIKPTTVDLVDPDGTVIASSRGAKAPRLAPLKPSLGRTLDRRTLVGGQAFRIAVRPVPGTPWRLAVSVPEARLYAPLSSIGRWLPWGGLAIFVLGSLAVAVLVSRLLTTRTALVADVTKRRGVERALREAQARFHQAFDEAPIGIALVGLNGSWRQVNRALCAMLHYTESELLALTREELTHPDDLEADLAQVERLVLGAIDHCDLEIRLIDARGDAVWALLSRSLVRDDDGRPIYLISQIQDISERRRVEAKLSHLADHDALTGLFNRRRFEQELERQVAYSERYGTSAKLLMLDLDNFKYVNDTLGHAMGDELLARVATALRERLRTNDIVARLGGDEFAFILPETDSAGAEQAAASILATIRHDGVVLHEHHAIQVTASIGIAPIDPEISRTPAELMINADVSMYVAKEAGRGRSAVHDPDGDSAARLTDSVTWAERIRSAILHEGFVLYQQPILDLRRNEITRHELLLRMIGPDGEHIPPAAFLHVAERFGLVQEIDRWVIRQAVGLIARQQRLGQRLRLEVNLSGLSVMSAEVLSTIEHELDQSQIDPSCLTFEIAETAAIVNLQKTRSFAERISQLGCGFALDDFAAGFGSFHHLKHLPFDVLKIDGELVRNLGDCVEDRIVVESLARIATELGKTTVAKFVEDDATRDLVRSYGLDYAQGYGIGRPQPVSEWLSLDAPPAAIAAPTHP